MKLRSALGVGVVAVAVSAVAAPADAAPSGTGTAASGTALCTTQVIASPPGSTLRGAFVESGDGAGTLLVHLNVDFLGEHTVIWHRDGSTTDLGNIGRTTDINRRSEIVGSDREGPFVYRDGAVERLPVPPGAAFASATAINDRGDVVGFTDQQGIVWPAGTPRTFQLLDTPEGLTSLARDIDERGRIVGATGGSFDVNQAFVWRMDGSVVTRLRTFTPTDGLISVGVGAISRGRAVGLEFLRNATSIAVVWDRSGRPTRLPGQDASAADISRAGLVGGADSGVAAIWRHGRQIALPQPSGHVGSALLSVSDVGIYGGNTQFLREVSSEVRAARWVCRPSTTTMLIPR